MGSSELLPTAILVPSLDRPQNIRRTVATIHDNTPESHFILWCVSDQASMAILDELEEWYLDDSDDEDRRYVTRMNKLLEHLDDAKTLFFGSDDVIHHPGWLSHALRVMEQGPSVVVCNDMHNPQGTQAVIRREYLERAVFDAPGLAFHPGYHHNFADNEMFFTASMQGQLAKCNEAIVEHLHPSWGSSNADPWDPTYRNAYAGWHQDVALWTERHARIAEALADPDIEPVYRYY